MGRRSTSTTAYVHTVHTNTPVKVEYEVINRKSKWNGYSRIQRVEIGTKDKHGQYQRKVERTK